MISAVWMQISCHVEMFLKKVFLSKLLKSSSLKFLLLHSVQISFKIPSLFGKSCRPIFHQWSSWSRVFGHLCSLVLGVFLPGENFEGVVAFRCACCDVICPFPWVYVFKVILNCKSFSYYLGPLHIALKLLLMKANHLFTFIWSSVVKVSTLYTNIFL